MSSTPTTRRFAGILTALTVAVATVLALGAGPAQAATGTTTVRICASHPSGTVTPYIADYWWNGSSWVQQASVQASCVTFTLGHSGYYYFRVSTYALLPCVEYVYGWTSTALIKQNMAASSSWSVTPQYERAISLWC